MQNKNVIISGGSDGVGKEIAIGMATLGFRLLIVGRDAEKGARVRSEIQTKTKNHHIQFLRADLSLISEADRLCNAIIDRFTEIHYLIHCAGIIHSQWELTEEGIEKNFATNYLSRFYITQRLLPVMMKSGEPGYAARILVVNGAVKNGRVNYDDVNLTNNFSLFRFVSQQCRANDLFATEMAERLDQQNKKSVIINNYKLGVVKTNIRKTFPTWLLTAVYVLDPLIGMSPDQAARPALELLVNRKYEGQSGAYIKILRFHKLKGTVNEKDLSDRKRLWELSERLIFKILN